MYTRERPQRLQLPASGSSSRVLVWEGDIWRVSVKLSHGMFQILCGDLFVLNPHVILAMSPSLRMYTNPSA